METIEFVYTCTDENGNDTKRVIIRKQDEGGLRGDDVCEAFEDLMDSVGFDMDCVREYFD